ncbi:MAG: hypothetical protein GWM88_07215 [Pseudomonadales bacterium]|nr:hypothetical protein [Pseudomonadales bacterium]NIX07805.1 hypothetical protein [Pseudomonadales bacterium]
MDAQKEKPRRLVALRGFSEFAAAFPKASSARAVPSSRNTHHVVRTQDLRSHLATGEGGRWFSQVNVHAFELLWSGFRQANRARILRPGIAGVNGYQERRRIL